MVPGLPVKRLVVGLNVCESAPVGIVELGVVEDVVRLHAELQFADAVTREVEVLGEDQVGVVGPGAVVGVAPHVAELADGLLAEGGAGVLIPDRKAVEAGCSSGVGRLKPGDLQRNVGAGVETVAAGAPERVGAADSEVVREAGGDGRDAGDLPAGEREVLGAVPTGAVEDRRGVDGSEDQTLTRIEGGVSVVQAGLVAMSCGFLAMSRRFSATKKRRPEAPSFDRDVVS